MSSENPSLPEVPTSRFRLWEIVLIFILNVILYQLSGIGLFLQFGHLLSSTMLALLIAGLSLIFNLGFFWLFGIRSHKISWKEVGAYNFDFVTEVMTTNAMMLEVKRLSGLKEPIFPENIARHIIAKITNTVMIEVDDEEVSKLMTCDPYNIRN